MTPAGLRPLFSALAVLLLLQTAGCQVLAVRLEGSITPASDDIVAEAIREAERENHQALMLLLDTPGGGLTETKEILRLIEETDLPVIGYVHPEGATAWSAGTLILMGTDIASMAPHTIIGSAQPVRLSPLGEAEPINDSKTTNAIVALIAEEAKEHNRNTTAAREFVVSNLNLNADEARLYGVIEHISQSPEELLHQVDGVRTKNTTLATSGAEVLYFQPPLNLQFLVLLSDPTIASLLLLVGLYALIFGLSSPGIGAEAFGVVSLALGLIGLGFNVNLGAIFLLVLGVGLILAELHSHSFGILAVAGLVCVVAGSILLVPTSYPQWYVPGGYQRSMAFALVLPSLLLGLFLAFAIYKVARVRFAPPVTGRFMGEEAEVLDRLDPEGYVLFQGEYWQARAEEPLEKGERVVIVGRDGSVLRVRRR